MIALDLLDETIAELEARLHLRPGEALVPPRGTAGAVGGRGAAAGSTTARASSSSSDLPSLTGGPDSTPAGKPPTSDKSSSKKSKNGNPKPKSATSDGAPGGAGSDDHQQPEICKLEFRVGVIVKVWAHPGADKLYCEEIDVGEPAPRLIASGLRPHYALEEMLGRRVLVVANLNPKNLVGFKSHGMVLCAASIPVDGDGAKEHVEFVEPPDGAPVGEVVTFDGLPPPRPLSPAQVEKKKVFANCLPGLRASQDRVAAWNGHAFLTSAGPCTVPSAAGACLR
jgi:aminoacyl tRNA synthase complex-interacting multifunctional protein 1